ncbi:MAG TPA: hypothetical protein PKO05_11960 [Thermoanaerobaculia bacterium]|nr:hypothetical protein [Thermoanaerobaculia bacterium]
MPEESVDGLLDELVEPLGPALRIEPPELAARPLAGAPAAGGGGSPSPVTVTVACGSPPGDPAPAGACARAPGSAQLASEATVAR